MRAAMASTRCQSLSGTVRPCRTRRLFIVRVACKLDMTVRYRFMLDASSAKERYRIGGRRVRDRDGDGGWNRRQFEASAGIILKDFPTFHCKISRDMLRNH